MNAVSDVQYGLGIAWANVVTFFPKLVMFLAILLVGYFVARFLGQLFDKLLERLHFDQLVERGGVKRAMQNTGYDASDILGKLLFYSVFLFVLQMAFGVFGDNPVSALLTRIVLYLPNIFVAVLIVIVAAAIAKAVHEIIRGTLGGLAYGNILARIASVAIMIIAAFAALDQLQIAPAIVQGLFYAALAIIAGSAIVAIGGGGITPMRAQWEKALGRVEREAPKIASAAALPSALAAPASTASGEGWRGAVPQQRPENSPAPFQPTV